MIDRFLKAKHWQLFLLTFGIPMLFQFIVMSTMFTNFGNSNPPDPTTLLNYMKFYPVVMILYMGVYFGWFWSIVIGLQKKIPVDLQMKLKRFKIFFFIPLGYILFISIFAGSAMSGFVDGTNAPDPKLIAGLFAFILPLHLFSMFCIFHSIYFVAKTIKTVELQREPSFSDFAGEFFLIWFYPIGIWIVQPKVNEIIEEEAI